MANNYSAMKGALAAATFAGTGRQKMTPSLVPMAGASSGVDTVEKTSFRDHPSYRVGSASFGALQPAHSVRGRSPSQIAATLAVSRSSSNDYQALSTPGTRRVSPLRNTQDNVQPKALRPDVTPTPRTNTLVELFESKNVSKSFASSTNLLYVAGVPRDVASPTSFRRRPATQSTANNVATFSGPPKLHVNQNHMQSPLFYSAAKTDSCDSNAAVTAARLASPLNAHRTQLAFQPPGENPKPEPPPPSRSPYPRVEVAPQDQPYGDLKSEWPKDSTSFKYTPSPESTPGMLPLVGDAPRDESPRVVSIKNTRPLQRGPAPQGSSSRTASGSTQVRQVSTSNARTRETRPAHLRAESQMTVDSLANAIVASSLASSRAPSPTKPIPPLPRRQTKPYSLFRQHHNHKQSASRTPSPSKGLRQTMRGPPKSDEDDEHKRGSSNIIKKHPHKHHEGDRKRWRDQITERERKRYEGVWAANKGMYLAEDSQSAVCNLVVRDIWSRSRLSNHVLEEVWDLVDNEGVGRLNREEFVVGLWLIDQSLKGRKLPVTVSDSVWFSVRRLTGVKIPKNRR